VLSVILMNFLIRRHKLHVRVSLYEAALSAYQRTQERFWKSLKGRKFEKELGHLFALQGYHVDFTPASGDQGIDLILTRRNVTTIVQCKAHSKPIGPAIVRDLYGTLMASKARSAILASTQGFTKGVYDFSKGKRIKLFSLQDIIRLAEEVGQTPSGKPIQKKNKQ
jgi:restriction system protein